MGKDSARGRGRECKRDKLCIINKMALQQMGFYGNMPNICVEANAAGVRDRKARS